MKKFLIGVFSVLLVIIISGLSVTAEDPEAQAHFNKVGYGTYDDGIESVGTSYCWRFPVFSGDGHPNLDFEKGFEYWIVRKEKPVKIEKDSDGNTFLTLIPNKAYAGAATVRFKLSKLKVGDTPGILYKWRGDQHACQVSLNELYDPNEKEGWIRVGHDGNRGTTEIWAADEDNEKEWNIRLSINYNPVKAVVSGSEPYYSIWAEGTNNPELSYGINIDDIQVVIHNDQTRTVSDLDGKILYNLNNLPKREVVDYDFGKLGEKDANADIKVDIENVLNPENKANKNSGVLKWIIIAASIVILIAAAVITIVVFKKKKIVSAFNQ